MKYQELNKLSNDKLLELKKDLELNLIKASSPWSLNQAEDIDKKKRKTGFTIKGLTAKGTPTSLKKNIKKNIARVNTLINERKNGNSNIH